MRILAIDPGPESSAFVVFAERPVEFGKVPNDEMLSRLRGLLPLPELLVACEQVRSYGMPVGAEVFETVRWSGRFEEAILSRGAAEFRYVPRLTVKMALCHSARANDASIRQALIDRFGPKGTKAAPGVLYGFKADAWQALALAVTVAGKVDAPLFEEVHRG